MAYEYTLKRLQLVTDTVNKLIRRNNELETANRKLRDTLPTYDAREVSRERIIQSLEKKLDAKVVHTSEDIHPRTEASGVGESDSSVP